MSCFRSHNPSSASLSDEQLSAAIDAQHESGQLVTGLRRWRMRQPRRLAEQLSDDDRWDCVWGCGKSYRATSSRSIQRHTSDCDRRAVDSERNERNENEHSAHRKDGTSRKRRRGGEQQKELHLLSGRIDAQSSTAISSRQQQQQRPLSSPRSPLRSHGAANDFPSAAVELEVDERVTASRQRLLWSTVEEGEMEDVSRQYSLPFVDSADRSSISPSPTTDQLLPSPPSLTFLSSASFTSIELSDPLLPQQHSSSGCSNSSSSPLPLSLPLPPTELLSTNPTAAEQAVDSDFAPPSLFPYRPLCPPPPHFASTSFSFTRSAALAEPFPAVCEAEEVGGQLLSFLVSLYLRYGTRHPVFEQRVVSPALVAEAIARAMQLQRSH